MEINEIEYLYYGEKCIMLESILEQLELRLSESNDKNIIYIENRLETVEAIEKENAEVIPVVKMNNNIIEATGEIACKECSEKYGFEIKHKIYYSREKKQEEECFKIGKNEISKIINAKKCNKNGCSGGCCKH